LLEIITYTRVVTTQSPWYAVGAGLGAALIVATMSYLVARQQRRADMERFERQLIHDREQRGLDHIRVVLHPIVARAVDSDAIDAIAPALSECRMQKPIRGWPSQALADVLRHADLLERDRFALMVVLDPDSSVIASLKTVCDEITAIHEGVRLWLNDRLDFQIVDSRLREAIVVYANAVETFVHEAYRTAGWHESSAQ
jgi:hypothetical protein